MIELAAQPFLLTDWSTRVVGFSAVDGAEFVWPRD